MRVAYGVFGGADSGRAGLGGWVVGEVGGAGGVVEEADVRVRVLGF